LLPRLGSRGGLSQEAEARFWRRLNGEGQFASGSTLRVLRQDALSKEWVCYMADAKAGGSKPRQYKASDKRQDRAHQQPQRDDKCPLCVGREEATEVLRVWPNGELVEREGMPEDPEDRQRWIVRALRNPFPYLLTPEELYTTQFPGDRKKHAACFGDNDNEAAAPDAQHPLYQTADGFGASEVVVESPRHNELLGVSTDEQVGHGLRALAARGRSLRSCGRVLQLMYFKQYGAEASGSLIHPHMQVCSLPIVSASLRAALGDHREFLEAHGYCAVQKLYVEDVCGDNPLAVSRFLHKTEHFVASIPFAKVARGRIVIAPKRHCARFEDCSDEELMDLGAMLRLIMACLYRLRDDPSYNLFWETAPMERAFPDPADLEAVERSFCWTLHVRVPNKVSGFGLSSGVEVTRQLPEQEARELRSAIVHELAAPLRTDLGIEGTPRRRSMAELEFPATVGPFMMTQADLAGAFNAFYRAHRLPLPDARSDESFMAGFDPCLAGAEEGETIFCQTSPLQRITLDARSRAAASIPADAVYYAWSYPAAPDDAARLRGARSAERSFFEHGGFMYLSENREAVAATSISPAAFGTSLIFGGAQALPEEAAERLARQGRFQAITLEAMLRKDATHFGWLRPGEFSESVDCPHGAFAYRFSAGPPRYYPLIRGPAHGDA